MITDEQLAKWRKLCDAANKGPWIRAQAASGPTIATPPFRDGGTAALLAGSFACCEDVDFVAAARDAMPELLNEVERLRAEWRADSDQMVDQMQEIQVLNESLRAEVERAEKGEAEAFCACIDLEACDAHRGCGEPPCGACLTCLRVEMDKRNKAGSKNIRRIQALRAELAEARAEHKPMEPHRLKEIREAGEEAASRLDAFGGDGIPTDAYNAIVDLAHLLDEALKIATTAIGGDSGRSDASCDNLPANGE